MGSHGIAEPVFADDEPLISRAADITSITFSSGCVRLYQLLSRGLGPETARRLVRFRNRIAHAKPQQLTVERDYTVATYQKGVYKRPESDLEKMVTEELALKGYSAVEKILEELGANIEQSKLVELEMEGWSSLASAIEDSAHLRQPY